MPAVPTKMPSMLRAKFHAIEPAVSFISMLGSVTNRNGMKNVLQPTTTAVQPVVQPDTRAILAAA